MSEPARTTTPAMTQALAVIEGLCGGPEYVTVTEIAADGVVVEAFSSDDDSMSWRRIHIDTNGRVRGA